MELLNRIAARPKMVHIDWRHCKNAVGTFGVERRDRNTLTQWFPTGVPRHLRVLFAILMGAKNSYVFQYTIKVYFQNVIKPWSKLLWVRHWVPQIIFFFREVPKAKSELWKGPVYRARLFIQMSGLFVAT